MAGKSTGAFSGYVAPPIDNRRRLTEYLIAYPENYPIIAERINPSMMTEEHPRKILEALHKIWLSGKNLTPSNLIGASGIPPATFQILAGTNDYLPDDLEMLLDLAVEEYKIGEEIQIATDLLAKASNNATWDELDGIAARRNGLRELAFRDLNPEDDVVAAIKAMEERVRKHRENDGSLTGVPTGFPDLDKLTGGWQPSDLIIVGARPSTGKTALSLHIGNQAASRWNIPVAMISVEMDKAAIINRQLAWEAEVDSMKIRDGALDDDEAKKVVEAGEKRIKTPFYIDDKSRVIGEVVGSAIAMKSRYDIGLLIVDYLQMIKHPAYPDKRLEITAIVDELKALAKRLKIPIILLSQLRRSKSLKPQMDDLRESGAIEDYADLIALLYYDHDNAWLEIDIAKHRNGGTGLFFKKTNRATGVFYDINSYGIKDPYANRQDDQVPF